MNFITDNLPTSTQVLRFTGRALSFTAAAAIPCSIAIGLNYKNEGKQEHLSKLVLGILGLSPISASFSSSAKTSAFHGFGVGAIASFVWTRVQTFDIGKIAAKAAAAKTDAIAKQKEIETKDLPDADQLAKQAAKDAGEAAAAGKKAQEDLGKIKAAEIRTRESAQSAETAARSVHGTKKLAEQSVEEQQALVERTKNSLDLLQQTSEELAGLKKTSEELLKDQLNPVVAQATTDAKAAQRTLETAETRRKDLWTKRAKLEELISQQTQTIAALDQEKTLAKQLTDLHGERQTYEAHAAAELAKFQTTIAAIENAPNTPVPDVEGLHQKATNLLTNEQARLDTANTRLKEAEDANLVLIAAEKLKEARIAAEEKARELGPVLHSAIHNWFQGADGE